MARRFRIKTFAVAALAAATSFFIGAEALAQPHTRVGRDNVTGVGQTQDVIREPRFIVEAVSFKAVDESGRDLPYTSDEVFGYFRSSSPAMSAVTSNFENVDTGDLEHFDASQSCIWPAVDPDGQRNGRWGCAPQGGGGPIQFMVTLFDDDNEIPIPPNEFQICGGGEDDVGVCPELRDWFLNTNDILFENEFTYEVSDLLQRLDPSCRCLVQTAQQSVDDLTTYEFTFRITRVDAGDGPANERDPDGLDQPVQSSGTLTAMASQGFEFDAGAVVAPAAADFAFSRSGNTFFLTPASGAKIWAGGATARGYAACFAQRMSADYVTTQVNVPAVGSHACYVTSDGRVGEFRVDSLTPGALGAGGTLVLTYTTWQ